MENQTEKACESQIGANTQGFGMGVKGSPGATVRPSPPYMRSTD